MDQPETARAVLAQIAREEGHFDFDDVARGICAKMIRRHPHVFGTARVEDADGVVDQWDRIKETEEGMADRVSAVSGVPRHLPALHRAQRAGARREVHRHGPVARAAPDGLVLGVAHPLGGDREGVSPASGLLHGGGFDFRDALEAARQLAAAVGAVAAEVLDVFHAHAQVALAGRCGRRRGTSCRHLVLSQTNT